jgi:FlaG/FlaF family flagellin (archaellin)
MTLAAVIVLAGTAAACDDDTQDSVEEDVESAVTEVVDALDEASEDVVELAARNFASAQGEQEFEAAGHEIEGDLACEADATSDLTAVEIDCTGTTVDGGEASMTGTTSEFPGASFNELDGDFVGTVDGAEVFSTERLGG